MRWKHILLSGISSLVLASSLSAQQREHQAHKEIPIAHVNNEPLAETKPEIMRFVCGDPKVAPHDQPITPVVKTWERGKVYRLARENPLPVIYLELFNLRNEHSAAYFAQECNRWHAAEIFVNGIERFVREQNDTTPNLLVDDSHGHKNPGAASAVYDINENLVGHSLQEYIVALASEKNWKVVELHSPFPEPRPRMHKRRVNYFLSEAEKKTEGIWIYVTPHANAQEWGGDPALPPQMWIDQAAFPYTKALARAVGRELGTYFCGNFPQECVSAQTTVTDSSTPQGRE